MAEGPGGARQLRLLLWKDFLLRKRRPITVGGIVWALAALLSLVIVRQNVAPEPQPACRFASRALPTAGLLPFLQSFICQVNNECLIPGETEEIPTYSKSGLKKYQELLGPLISNGSVTQLLESLPAVGRLMASVARAVDQPRLHAIVRDGLTIKDIFKDPERAKNILHTDLQVPKTSLDSIFDSNVNFANVFEKVSSNAELECNAETISSFVSSANISDTAQLADSLCTKNSTEMQTVLGHLLPEINIKEYVGLSGEVLKELTGSDVMPRLAAMADAGLRLMALQNYVPQELQLHRWWPSTGDSPVHFGNFSYLSMDNLYRVLNLFRPLFNDTGVFKMINNYLDVASSLFSGVRNALGVNVDQGQGNSSVGSAIKVLLLPENIQHLSQKFQLLGKTVTTVFKKNSESSVDVLDILATIGEGILELLPSQTRHEFRYTLTLVTRALQGARDSATTALDMQPLLLAVCRRQPRAISLLKELGPDFIGSLIDGLADVDRIQAFTRKIFFPGQMFCDLNRVQTFLKISKEKATKIKPLICSAEWKAFVTDVIESFGVYNSSKMINNIASIVVSETLGSSSDSELVSLREALGSVSDLVTFARDRLLGAGISESPEVWQELLGEEYTTKVRQVLQQKYNQTRIIMVTIHTALAHEVISKNSILDTYIAPTLQQLSGVMQALSLQMGFLPEGLLASLRKGFVSLTELSMATLSDKDKTLNVLLANQPVVFCDMALACKNSTSCNDILHDNEFVVFPSDADAKELSQLLCDVSVAVTLKLNTNYQDDIFFKAIGAVISGTAGKDGSVNWGLLIRTMQRLFIQLDDNFGYIFRAESDDAWENARQLAERVPHAVLFDGKPENVMPLSVSLTSRILHTLDTPLPGLVKFPAWRKFRSHAAAMSSVIFLGDKFVNTIAAFIMRDQYFEIDELPLTSKYLRDLGLNFPALLRDSATFIASKQVDVSNMVTLLQATPAWPCSSPGLSAALQLGQEASVALRGAESLLCAAPALQAEWDSFPHLQRLYIVANNTNSTTSFITEPVFLELGRNFNLLVEDLQELQHTAEVIYGPNGLNTSQQFSLLDSWKQAVNIIEEKNVDNSVIRQMLRNLDTLLAAANYTQDPSDEQAQWSTARLWEKSQKCSGPGCRNLMWQAAHSAMRCLSHTSNQVVADLTEYFTQISEPDANTLQFLGFTNRTGPYILYSKMPQFLEALMNSYLDLGFMKQVQHSLGKQFWDCDRLLESMVTSAAPGITSLDVARVRPYICPTIVHWVSVPIDENVLLDVFAKSQLLLFNTPASTFTATYEELFNNSLKLKDKMAEITNSNAKKEYSLWTQDWLDQFDNIGSSIISPNSKNIKTADILNSTYLNNGLNTIYITRITSIINDLLTDLKALNETEKSLQNPNDQKSFKLFYKLLEKRLGESIEIFVFSITEKLLSINDHYNYDLIDSIDYVCANASFLTKENMWMKTNPRVVSQFCKSDYRKYMMMVRSRHSNGTTAEESIGEFVEGLIVMEEIYRNQTRQLDYTWKNILRNMLSINGPEPGQLIRRISSHARELGTAGLLQLSDMHLGHQRLTADFVSGQDWWAELRRLYNGPHAVFLLDALEKSPLMLEDFLKHIADVKVVRLLKDIQLNSTDLLCGLAIGEYIPDHTGALQRLLSGMCSLRGTDLGKDVPSLGLVAKVYDEKISLRQPSTLQLQQQMAGLQRGLETLLQGGLHPPKRPTWLLQLPANPAAPSSLDLAFLAIGNILDGATLFINSTYSPVSAALTPWVKQVNLQLIKREEYATLLCELPALTDDQVHTALQDDFHWDLALSEVVSGRNYTWVELNRALGQLLGLARRLAGGGGTLTSLGPCLLNTTRDAPMDQAALYLSLGARSLRLLRAALPHLRAVPGMASAAPLVALRVALGPTLLTPHPVATSIPDLQSKILQDNQQPLLDAKVDLSKVEKLVDDAFWSFSWLMPWVRGVEDFLWSSGQLSARLTLLNFQGLSTGNISATTDLVLYLLRRDFLTTVAMRLEDILNAVEPVLGGFELQDDLRSVVAGIRALKDLWIRLHQMGIKLEINNTFRDWPELKKELRDEGNLTQDLLDILQFGTLDFASLLSGEGESLSARDIICSDTRLRDILPGTPRRTLRELAPLLCSLSEQQGSNIANTLIHRLNYTYIIDVSVKMLISQVLEHVNLTQEQGESAALALRSAASLAPELQPVITNITSQLGEEPLILALQQARGVSDLLENPDFLAHVGNMMCGKPFQTNTNRFYKTIAETPDYSKNLDQNQLNSLPTDYCRGLYKEVTGMAGGKILWSYAKPLMMGKLLYSPNTPEAATILKAANGSFATVGHLMGLMGGLAGGLSSLDELRTHPKSLDTLGTLASSVAGRAALKRATGGPLPPDLNLQHVLDQFGDTKEMGELVDRMTKIAACIRLDRFVGLASETELEQKAAELAGNNEFMAGIVFTNIGGDLKNKSGAYNVEYKIRMDIDNVPSTSRFTNQFWSPGPDANFLENLRYFRGFIQLQDLLDRAIMDSSTELSRRVARQTVAGDWEVHTKQMPYPCWVKDEFQRTMYESQALIVAFFFCLILTVSSVVRNMVWERESGNTDLMCVMGMRRCWHTLSWMTASLVEVLITMAVLCFVLKVGGILPLAHSGFLLLLLLNFGVAIVMFCYLVSALFRSASLAAVSAAIFYLLSYLPYIIVIAMEAQLTLLQKLITCLSMSTSFSYSMLLAARLELGGGGLGRQSLWAPQGGLSPAVSALMVLMVSILLAAIAWLINTLRFRDIVGRADVAPGVGSEPQEMGVRIRGLCKDYGVRQALSNVSLDLRRGHITTLLGHNGAGKTTLIKILTGMEKADAGSVTILGAASHGRHTGLCPQADVLLEALTAHEHLSYYAQLKTGLPAASVHHLVANMEEALSLGALAHEPVSRLSGGLRRRVAVGLAFVAEPPLVVLDEPSSGVDPVARRELWALVTALRAHRTVLLTTHHLDEAELLSDTVVILHKGRVCASGTPLQLKQQYGTGYLLTLHYPLPTELQTFPFPDGPGAAASLGLMLATTAPAGGYHIRSGQPGELLVDIPYHDSKGMPNDMVAITRALETQQNDLGFGELSADCSGLEDVFLRVCEEQDSQVSTDREVICMETGEGHVRAVYSNPCLDLGADNEKNGMKEAFDTPKNGHAHDMENGDSHKITDDFEDEIGFEKDVGPISGSMLQQLRALMYKRWQHYTRSSWLLVALLLLPTAFVAAAMGFSLIRPPPDSHRSLLLSPQLYRDHSAEFVSLPDAFNPYDHDAGDSIIKYLMEQSVSQANKTLEMWSQNNRTCQCDTGSQVCHDDVPSNIAAAFENRIVVLPSAEHLQTWAITTQDLYNEKRYGGWSVARPLGNTTRYVVWYNNKGHHSLPAYLSELNSAVLQQKLRRNARIRTYNHPLKLSHEQLSRSTLLQHVADVGISIVLLIGFSLVPAGGAAYLVAERVSLQKRLQLLSGVSPLTYWLASLLWDSLVILVAIFLSVCIFEIFGLPIYVARDNLPAICVLLLLYGFASSCLMHILEKLFVDASLANMVIFCSNVFGGVSGLTVLLIIDVLTSSDLMQSVRWWLHTLFLLWPQFSLGDGLVEISKNSIQADILQRFGLDTYASPLGWRVIGPHCVALVITSLVLFIFNIALEIGIPWFRSKRLTATTVEDEDVIAERSRVLKEGQSDVLQARELRCEYPGVGGTRLAVDNLTFGLQQGQVFGLIGVNGAGKSTTFKILSGELRPTTGHVLLHGKRASSSQLCCGSIAYCPQNDALDLLLTLKEHLEFYCQIRGLDNVEKRVQHSMQELDLQRYASLRTSALSGGNKRKLCMAIALLGRAPIVLLDEPTSGMDPATRLLAGAAVRAAAARGRAVLLSSHSLLEVEGLAHSAALAWRGRLLALGPPAHLKHRFGGGYLVTLRVGPRASEAVMARAFELLPGARASPGAAACRCLLVPLGAPGPTSLSALLERLASLAATEGVLDYYVKQSTLDQVFINFSESHSEKRGASIRLGTLQRHYGTASLAQPQLTVTKL